MLRYSGWLKLAALAAVAGCADVTGPPQEPHRVDDLPVPLGRVTSGPTPSSDLSILRQSPGAPPLETYQVSFWASPGAASLVQIGYLPVEGEQEGQRFLTFFIPEGGVKSIPGVRKMSRSDSVLITATIDPVAFSIDFQPSGVTFDKKRPAVLLVWHANADPDLNRDGAVDATDEDLKDQLSIWTRQASRSPWRRLMSRVERAEFFVLTAVFHFSEYAVSW